MFLSIFVPVLFDEIYSALPRRKAQTTVIAYKLMMQEPPSRAKWPMSGDY